MKKPSLLETHPDLAVQWSPKNGGRPGDFTHGSGKTQWWRHRSVGPGPEWHEWEDTITHRTQVKPRGCPFCAGMRVLKGFNDAATFNPELIAEWSPRNALRFDQVPVGTSRVMWWVHTPTEPRSGPLTHEWTARVSARTHNATGCPFCSGLSALPGFNDLASERPELVEEWSPKNLFSPDKVRPGSARRVIWRHRQEGPGPALHEWESTVASRTGAKPTGCPICVGQQVLAGFNSLADRRNDLAAEWHPKNAVRPDAVSISSNLRVWWRHRFDGPGPEWHEWQASVRSRAGVRSPGCAICTGKVALRGFNSLADSDQELIGEWHPRNTRPPEAYTTASGQKVWWRHKSHGPGPEWHEWEASVASRAVKKTGCPFCTGRCLRGFNDLATLRPDLASEWHPSMNLLQSDSVTSGSAELAWWLCKSSHSYRAAISSRNAGSGCGYCSGRRVIAGLTDLGTRNPSLATELSPENTFSAQDVTISSGRVAAWVCSKNASHKWKAPVSNRTAGTGCPHCAQGAISAVEREFFAALSCILDGPVNSARVPLPGWTTRADTASVDISGRHAGHRVAIEYDGSYFHRDAFDRDTRKTGELLKAGWAVVRIRENDLPHLPVSHPHLLQLTHERSGSRRVHMRDGKVRETVMRIEEWLLNSFGESTQEAA